VVKKETGKTKPVRPTRFKNPKDKSFVAPGLKKVKEQSLKKAVEHLIDEKLYPHHDTVNEESG